MLKEIQGRSTDFVVAADGTVMHGLALVYILRDLPGLHRFKIVQHTLTETQVLLQPESDFDADRCLPLIVEGFKRRLGEQVHVKVEICSVLPAERSGKFRYVVSHVKAGASVAEPAEVSHA